MIRSARDLRALLCSCALGLGLAASAFAQTPDCAGPAGDPAAGTPEWDQRDQDNQVCAEERHGDHAQHPVLAPVAPYDQYRAPARHDGVRFRYELVAITNRDGEIIEAEIYAPCKLGSCANLPAALSTFEPALSGCGDHPRRRQPQGAALVVVPAARRGGLSGSRARHRCRRSAVTSPIPRT